VQAFEPEEHVAPCIAAYRAVAPVAYDSVKNCHMSIEHITVDTKRKITGIPMIVNSTSVDPRRRSFNPRPELLWMVLIG
jgi:hypothetical protein